ncbi:hypothetical protein FB567DRAFT_227073 [Paraphoma chrysanthemicola]|uniref:Uncharacterized protein n=1 Tax=Paraphoma chrysanthemicola TaxID=798071 RepID=A0A8K0RFY9_9PLEO|nr:hypothetical protein FB567DRAFT_227073 [Paraphoma chrysanthemicola]
MSTPTHAAPPAPQQTVATAPTPAAEASHANFSRPATAHSTAPNATTNTQHATATAPIQSLFPGASAPPATEEPQNLNQKLNAADRYWKFKGVFQLIAIITGFIGIGTMGWLLSTSAKNGYTYGYDAFWSLWPSLLTFTVSIVWCLACILVLVLRKRPVHPGLRVAMDLLLWLGFIFTTMFAMVSLLDLISWGEYGDLGSGYYSSYGDYVMADNGTWVWQADRDYNDYARSCDKNSTSTRSSYYDGYSNTFQNCAEQDAFINQLWAQKPHRESVEMTGVVCQFFGLVLHFVLFVWACVDCHRHNRTKVSKDAEKLAASIVQTMITNGAVIPPPGQAHMRPAGPWGGQVGYYPLPQQGQAYPMTAMHPQTMPQGQQMPQQHHAQQPTAGMAGPSNEKSEGPRYA